MMLAVSDLTVRFGGITALDGVSFGVAAGEICGLIGPNGAGKTTLFNCLSRLYEPAAGDIRLDGRSILDLRPHGIAATGIARTFQNLALFDRMSALDNVLAGGHTQSPGGLLREILRTRATREEERRLRARAHEWLAFVGLDGQAETRVAELPFGSRKRIEIARALMGEPRLLLLDEPAGGLAAEELGRLETLIDDLRTRLAITILLVEHRMGLVMALCNRLVVLNFGRVIADGPCRQVAQAGPVLEAYLGPGR